MPALSQQQPPRSVVVLHAQEDEEACGKLVAHLASYQQQKLITVWHRGNIPPGEDCVLRTEQRLRDADLVLVLVTAELFSDLNLQTVLERQLCRETDGVRLIPVLVRPVDWHHSLLGGRQPLPREGKPIAIWAEPDAAWQLVAEGVIEAAWPARHTPPPHLVAPLVSTQSYKEAQRLIKTQLPVLLARADREPLPVLLRLEVPTEPCQSGHTPLDRWTYLCAWLSDLGTPGVVYTLLIVDHVQEIAFSEALSRWAAAFIAALLSYIGDGGNGGVVPAIKRLVTHEEERWKELRRQVEILFNLHELNSRCLEHVKTLESVWSNLSLAIAGAKPRVSTALAGRAVDHKVADQQGPLERSLRAVQK